MKQVVAIVQARMGSARLPGKSMIKLGGKPIIEHVLGRVRRAKMVAEVVLATSYQDEDGALCDVAVRLGVQVFRGPEDDVLKRYILAAQKFRADVVVRICGDNPLVAPEEIDRIVIHHLQSNADYSFNHQPALDNCYPDGLGGEVINYEVLETIDRQCDKPHEREHVTSYIWDHLEEFHVETVVAPKGISGPYIKLDVDCEADLGRLQVLFSRAPTEIEAWKAVDIVRTYRQEVGEESNTAIDGDEWRGT